MGKVKQLQKNAKLSNKLAEYIASNPAAVKDVPSDASFVVFSEHDNKLNELNSKLVKSLEGEGKEVVEAWKKDSKKTPWTFNFAV